MSEAIPEFSVVVPVSDNDVDLVPRTLPKWLGIPAGEIILCVDRPAKQVLTDAIRESSNRDIRLRVIEVPKNSGWMFHQAFVRRTGFRAARFEKILTGDIDVMVNGNVLRAVQLVGRNNIGVANLQKQMGSSRFDVLQNSSRRIIRLLKKEAYFTGLYALYRPFWLDTENEEEAKKVPHPLSHGALEMDDEFFVSLASEREATPPPYLGDDTMLKRAMLKKHRVVSLPQIGGVELRTETDNRPAFQARQAVRLFRDGRSLAYITAKSILYARRALLQAYAHIVVTKFGAWFLLREMVGLPLTTLAFLETLTLRMFGVRVRRRRL